MILNENFLRNYALKEMRSSWNNNLTGQGKEM